MRGANLIDLVLSGGQTGADQAGLRAARACGVKTGGWAPDRWMTESGPAPWLADWGLRECPERGYAARTKANAAWADVTLWFGVGNSRGYWCTRKACEKAGKPFVEIGTTFFHDCESLTADKLIEMDVKVLNIAGHREWSSPGIGEWVEAYVYNLLQVLKERSER